MAPTKMDLLVKIVIQVVKIVLPSPPLAPVVQHPLSCTTTNVKITVQLVTSMTAGHAPTACHHVRLAHLLQIARVVPREPFSYQVNALHPVLLAHIKMLLLATAHHAIPHARLALDLLVIALVALSVQFSTMAYASDLVQLTTSM